MITIMNSALHLLFCNLKNVLKEQYFWKKEVPFQSSQYLKGIILKAWV